MGTASKGSTVPLALEAELLELGIKDYVMWEPERHPMFLVVGSTGSGKSYFLRLLLGKVSTYFPNSELWLFDFKDIDFREFADCPRRFSYENCMQGLNEYYDSFKSAIEGKADGGTVSRKFMVFDEWAAFVMSRKDKKEQDGVKSILSTLLMMDRGVNPPHHVIIGLQRADSQLFPLGGRDQFSGVVALANISIEQRQMVFYDNRDYMENHINGRGEGFLHLDGDKDGLKRIVVPTATNHEKLNNAIRDGLSR